MICTPACRASAANTDAASDTNAPTPTGCFFSVRMPDSSLSNWIMSFKMSTADLHAALMLFKISSRSSAIASLACIASFTSSWMPSHVVFKGVRSS